MANGVATMTEIWRYFAGDTLDKVPATLTADQKRDYPLAKFRADWNDMPETDRDAIKSGIGNGSFTY